MQNIEIAEDLVQETFLRLWQKRQQVPGSHNFPAYIFQIAYHLVIDWARKNQVHKRILQKAVINEQPSLMTECETEFDELTAIIVKNIKALPPAMQQAFLLHRTANLTYKEIASVMGITKKSVEKHISGALKRLRRELYKVDFL